MEQAVHNYHIKYFYGNNVTMYYKRLLNFRSNFTSAVKNVRYILDAKNIGRKLAISSIFSHKRKSNKSWPPSKCYNIYLILYIHYAYIEQLYSWYSLKYTIGWKTRYNKPLFWLLMYILYIHMATKACALPHQSWIVSKVWLSWVATFVPPLSSALSTVECAFLSYLTDAHWSNNQ